MQTHMSNPHTRVCFFFSLAPLPMSVLSKESVKIIGSFAPAQMEHSSVAAFSLI